MKTDVTVVIDRSGSMHLCKNDAEGGLNNLIKEQKEGPGECTFSLVEFDDEYNFVHKGVPISEVTSYTLSPRGCTALLDAVGKSISEAKERIESLPEADKPGLVIFAIITDGGENASEEYELDQVKALIEEQQNGSRWQFTFLGANQDAFKEARKMGIARNGVANYAAGNEAQTCGVMSASISRMRSASVNGYMVKNDYTDEERKAMSGE